MTEYTAIFRTERTGNVQSMKREYPSKNKFYKDLRGNGFRVIDILTNEEIAELKQISAMDFRWKQIGKRNKKPSIVHDYINQVL
jgi:hypothetical protein